MEGSSSPRVSAAQNCAIGDCGESEAKNCDAICAAQGKVCDQTSLNALTNRWFTHSAFHNAGFQCEIDDRSCESGRGSCAAFGSPYLSNVKSDLMKGKCSWGDGKRHAHASCDRNHVGDANRRLCPCKKSGTKTPRNGWNNNWSNPPGWGR